MPDTATTATKLEQFVWVDKDSLQTMRDKYNSSMSQLGEIITGIQDSVDKVEGFTGTLDDVKSDVNQVKEDMTKVKSDMTEVKKSTSAISGIQTDLNAVKEDMTTVKSDMSNAKSDIEGIQGDINTINVSVKKMEDFMADPPTGSVTSEPATDIVIE